MFALVSFGSAAWAATPALLFQQGRLAAEVSWERGPVVGTESVMHLQWRRTADHSPVDPGASFEVILDMPMMGHGSVPTQIQKLATPGEYRVTSVYFLMEGDWNVMITLHPASGPEETQMLPVHID